MFRILSLDGGGIMGTFTASVLATLEDKTDHRLNEHFDLMTGTSTGGILALGLGFGFEAKELLEFYNTKGPNIFPATSRVSRAGRTLRQLFTPKLSVEPLRDALADILQDRLFGQATSRLVIPTYDAVEGRIYMFKTAHHQRFDVDLHLPAVDVALATSAAPTYFQAAQIKARQGSQFVDGGVWANNPTLVGVVEAISFLGVSLDEIDVLSVGTTTSPFNIAQHAASGAAKWNVGLIELLMNSQAEASAAQASLLVGGRVHRIDHMTKPGEYKMDDGRREKINQLIELGRGTAVKKEHLDAVKARFLNGRKVTPFQPIHNV